MTSGQQLINEGNFQYGGWQNTDRKLYSCQRPLRSIRPTPENMTVLNGKQKVLLGGKQLKDNA